MKYFLSTALFMSSILSSSLAHAEPYRTGKGWHNYQDKQEQYPDGYKFCIENVNKRGQLMEFHKMSPEEKADYCSTVIQAERPDLAKVIDLEFFKKQFIEGRFQKNPKQ
jgi:hypothetical protein